MKRKYLFKDRAEAEAAVEAKERELTLHRIALVCLLRDEFTWTQRFEAEGTWFEIGLARASSAHGGLLLVREYYPSNRQPSQYVRWAEEYLSEMGTMYGHFTPADAEGRAYRECIYAAREMLYRAQHAA
jgi:hypothetical protein